MIVASLEQEVQRLLSECASLAEQKAELLMENKECKAMADELAIKVKDKDIEQSNDYAELEEYCDSLEEHCDMYEKKNAELGRYIESLEEELESKDKKLREI